MRTLLYVLPGAAIMALAFWAYSENYETQKALRAMKDLRAQIAAERETLAVLRAEWAYLNRPERLRDLADLNFDRLGLLPLTPEQFARIDQIDDPSPETGANGSPVAGANGSPEMGADLSPAAGPLANPIVLAPGDQP